MIEVGEALSILREIGDIVADHLDVDDSTYPEMTDLPRIIARMGSDLDHLRWRLDGVESIRKSADGSRWSRLEIFDNELPAPPPGGER